MAENWWFGGRKGEGRKLLELDSYSFDRFEVYKSSNTKRNQLARRQWHSDPKVHHHWPLQTRNWTCGRRCTLESRLFEVLDWPDRTDRRYGGRSCFDVFSDCKHGVRRSLFFDNKNLLSNRYVRNSDRIRTRIRKLGPTDQCAHGTYFHEVTRLSSYDLRLSLFVRRITSSAAELPKRLNT